MARQPDVVTDTPIESAWGNTVRDRTVVPFANAGERSQQWPTPAPGAHSTTADRPGVLWYYDGATWRAYGDPPGTLREFAGPTTPAGYLLCDGAAYPRASYAELFAAIGTTWNIGGEAATDFRVPNLSGRATIGTAVNRPLGQLLGAETHTLTDAEMPEHQHSIGETLFGGGFIKWADQGTSGILQISGGAGGDQPHNNMQPSAVVLKIIKT